MPGRCFANRLADYRGGTIVVNQELGIRRVSALHDAIRVCDCAGEPSAYTGAAGIAYALWHVSRHASKFLSVLSESELLEHSELFARAALHAVSQPAPGRHAPSLLAGEAGVYCVGALTLGARAGHAEGTVGQEAQAAKLRQEQQWCLQQFCALHRFACSHTCHEDEVLYGRSGYLLGCLLLNRQLHSEAVPAEVLQNVVAQIIQSGRNLADCLRGGAAFPTPLLYMWPPGADALPYLGAAHGLMGEGSAPLRAAGRQCAAAEASPCGSPLFFRWHKKPYLGAAHGLIGILYALLHVPQLVAAVGAQRDVEAALRYILSLECHADGQPGPGGEYPAHMGPWRDKEPLVHWCHGATGAVFLLCKAHEQLGLTGGYLAAAKRSGEAVWQRGLLRKGNGCCHGVSGSAYALLRLYRTTKEAKWLHRAVQFAEFMSSDRFRSGSRTPDHPLSLYEGSAAELCLWADLLGDPGRAGFPLFEVDI